MFLLGYKVQCKYYFELSDNTFFFFFLTRVIIACTVFELLFPNQLYVLKYK